MDTAEHIKKAREAAGISQAHLANLVGVAPSTPYRWEAGKATPQSGAMERRIARALGAPVQELFPYEAERATPAVAQTS